MSKAEKLIDKMTEHAAFSVRRVMVLGDPRDPSEVVWEVRWPNASVFQYGVNGFQSRKIEFAFRQHKSKAKLANEIKTKADWAEKVEGD